VTATGGPSGITGLSCTLDGNSLPDTYGDIDIVGAAGSTQTAFVSVPANGAHNLACSADNTGSRALSALAATRSMSTRRCPSLASSLAADTPPLAPSAVILRRASGQNWAQRLEHDHCRRDRHPNRRSTSGGSNDHLHDFNGYTTRLRGHGPEQLAVVRPIAQNTPFVDVASFADPTHGGSTVRTPWPAKSTSLAGLTGADGRTQGRAP